MRHLIKKQLIELNVNAGLDAFRMQHLISNHYNHKILPAIESIFNEYCREDEVLKLDKLEIDLGEIPVTEMEEIYLSENVVLKFKTKLREKLALVSAGTTVARESKEMNNCRQWIAYMQTGYLPWNALEINEVWHQQVLETLATDFAIITLLRNLILNNSFARHRIALQYPDAFLTKLVEIITAKNQQQLPDIAAELNTIINVLNKYVKPPMYGRIALIKEIWQQVLFAAANDPGNFSIETFVSKFLQIYTASLPVETFSQKDLLSQVTLLQPALNTLFKEKTTIHFIKNLSTDSDDISQKENIPVIEKEKIFTDDTNEVGINEPEKKIDGNLKNEANNTKEGKISAKIQPSQNKLSVDKETDVHAPLAERIRDKTGEDKINIERTGLTFEQVNDKQSIKSPVKSEATFSGNKSTEEHIGNKPLNELIPDDGIFISHAGIVISHPFLIHLFGRLHWLHNKKFVDEEKREKAVFLLHYLASGQRNAVEHSLVLYKILCAYPLEMPMPVEVIFTEEELTEATDMLTALILQWSKLQNTSIEGLRDGFLQRKGKLFIKNTEAVVQVETSAIDVLLDYLPWNLSLIKLPWMKEKLRIEWR